MGAPQLFQSIEAKIFRRDCCEASFVRSNSPEKNSSLTYSSVTFSRFF